MKKIICFTLIALFFSNISFSQTESFEPLTINKLDVQFKLKDNIGYYSDASRKLTFDDIKKIPFKKSDKFSLDIQSKTWRKFYLKPELASKKLIISVSYLDSSNVYVPYKNGYKKFTLGLMTNIDVDFSIFDTSIVYVPTDSIDFSKPFYYDKVILTRSGELSANNYGYVILADNTDIWKNEKNKKSGYTKTVHVSLAILAIAMLMFLMNYFVTKDENFFNYSLYLFFTILIFSSRIPFLVNILNNISPLLLGYLSHSSIILASVSYFYFVVSFLDVKQDYPKIYPLVKYTIIASLIFAVFSIIQLMFFPYLKYRYDILKLYDIIFVIISITIFIYLVTKRLTLVKRIVIFGSFLLIIGQLISLTTGNTYYFIGSVVLEIIAFSSVVSFQNKQTNYNRILSEAALQKETLKRENLQELDALKSSFITNITHEFRTPLTIIQGYVDNLNEQFNDNKEVTSTLNTIKKSSNNLLNLVNQMLDLDALENKQLSIKFIQSDIIAYSKGIINGLINLASEKHITINFNAHPDEILMDFDTEKLRQILSNLIINAIKFSPEHSEIKINFNKLDNKTLKIEIIDYGCGIAEEHLSLIFDRFFQVEDNEHKVSQGTGIGLALTKELVELFKGTITVTSKLSIGTTFTLKIPITNNAEEKNSSIKDTPITMGTVVPQLDDVIAVDDFNTVLIVEDNAEIATYIASCLQQNYSVSFAKNGKEGLEFAETNIPDIIVTDVMMPIMDGFQLTQKLQTNANTNHIPIIMLTSKSEHQDKLVGISSGADAYLTKPFEKDELLLRMQMLIAKRKQLQERYKVNSIIEKKHGTESPFDKNLVFLNALVDAIHQHIDDSNFGAKELAQFMTMSDSQLYRKLKAISNTSTALFIRKVRLEKAKELLKNDALSISEIAYATGFNDPNWFSKAFKDEFKVNPSEFRN